MKFLTLGTICGLRTAPFALHNPYACILQVTVSSKAIPYRWLRRAASLASEIQSLHLLKQGKCLLQFVSKLPFRQLKNFRFLF